MDNRATQSRIVEVEDFVAAAPTMSAEESLRRYARLVVSGDGASEGATSEVLRATNPVGAVLARGVLRPARVPTGVRAGRF